MELLKTYDGIIHIIDIQSENGKKHDRTCIASYGTKIDYMSNILRAAVEDQTD